MWFSGGDEFVAEGFEDGVVTSGDEGAHVEGGTDDGASAADAAFAFPLAGLAGPGGEAGEGGDLAAVEQAEGRMLPLTA